MKILVIGGGVFGCRDRAACRHAVTIVDPGPIPHPLAESTDISKVVRTDDGAASMTPRWRTELVAQSRGDAARSGS